MAVSLVCSMWNKYLLYIESDHNLQECPVNASDAMKQNFMKHLFENTNKMFASDILEVSGNSMVFNISSATNAEVSDLITFAYIGKHFTQNNFKFDNPYFQFHHVTDTLQRIQPKCEFEKVTYLSMIVITVLVLISQLLVNNIISSNEKTKQDTV